ncbi:MAG: hypothetical protein GY705_06460 [Bacteroidetes bacterium]|nr:hypothetical protein [Bacteroidota bacterium]
MKDILYVLLIIFIVALWCFFNLMKVSAADLDAIFSLNTIIKAIIFGVVGLLVGYVFVKVRKK